MYKRILALVLILCLMASAVPASAEPETREGQICQAIADDYRTILENTNMASLQGYCGLMASWQLYLLGVCDWVDSYHGKDQFDAYCQTAVTSGGHPVQTYSYLDYTLAEALNAITRNGERDVYNLLVGFQRTATAQGSIYGHSVVIYAILDGTVYFTESYASELGPAGTPYRISIEEFAAYYADWTEFEGIALFGKKGYVANCQAYNTNLFAEVTEPAALYTQPCTPESGEEPCHLLRIAQAGERLWVNGLFRNPLGQWYYQVDDSGAAGYVAVERLTPVWFNYEDVGATDLQIPEKVEPGTDFTLTGRIGARYSAMGAVEVTVTDETGNTVIRHALAKRSGVYDLAKDSFRAMVDLSGLEEGNYTFAIRAEGVSHFVADGSLQTHSRTILLSESPVRVGDVEAAAEQPAVQSPVSPDGWFYEEGTWYYYQDGAPRTGWYCCHGADYYLQPDGSVTTGWAKINGKYRYFSRTGAMRTGWMETEAGTVYLMTNGAPATGRRTIDGRVYVFNENGLLQ